MNYRYDQQTDTFRCIDNEPKGVVVQLFELTDDCIERIAEAVVRKMRGEEDGD